MNPESSYDQVADEYLRRIFAELQHKPLARQFLDRLAANLREAGSACDIGRGPGHVARYLQERGVQVCGIDLSLLMVEPARCLAPAFGFLNEKSLERRVTASRRKESFHQLVSN